MGLGLSFGFSMCCDFLAPFWGQPQDLGRAGIQGAAHGQMKWLHQLVLKTLQAYVAEATSATFLAFSHRLPGTQEAVFARDLI